MNAARREESGLESRHEGAGGGRGATTGTVPECIERALARLLPGWPEARVGVALSGGVDSVVLLEVCAGLRSGHPGLSLRALHVHHGLQRAADDWARHCAALCSRLDVPLDVLRLGLAPARGTSVEAEARAARYAALAARLAVGEALLTAHHADDQLETVLLQLMRGAGVAGLAAMPEVAPLGRGLHLRPMLGLPRAAVEDYARQRGLDWIEDPMNVGERFDRAYLRARVTPALRARWPAVARSVSRTARHMAEARALLDELADLDAAGVLEGEVLRVEPLRGLSRPRQANLVRRWLRGRGLGVPSAARLGAGLDALLDARQDRMPVLSWPTGELRRYRGRLYAMAPLGAAPPPGWERPIEPGATVELPCGLGKVTLRRSEGPAISEAALRAGAVLRFRRGGERLRPLGRKARHSLAALFQEARVEPWLRPRLPLLVVGGAVVAVADRWLEASAVDEVGGWRLDWRR